MEELRKWLLSGLAFLGGLALVIGVIEVATGGYAVGTLLLLSGPAVLVMAVFLIDLRRQRRLMREEAEEPGRVHTQSSGGPEVRGGTGEE